MSKIKRTVKKIEGTPAEKRRRNKQQKMMGMAEEGDYVPIIEAPKGEFKIRVGKGKEDPTDTERRSKLLESLKKKKYGGKINYRMGGGQVVDASYD